MTDKEKYKTAFMKLYDDALEVYRDLYDSISRDHYIIDDAISCRLCPFFGADCNGLRDVPPAVCREDIFKWYLEHVTKKEDNL
ncbi:MAG: hypothetical protein IKJ07_07490 [Clostridia bacterium]|nr:hypothetical protein [Clostridia bacterium]